MVATEGDEVLLHCSAEANPNPSITWLFNSAEVDGVLANGSLLLSPVQVTNEGNYTCRATNSIGLDEAVVFLSILGKLCMMYLYARPKTTFVWQISMPHNLQLVMHQY